MPPAGMSMPLTDTVVPFSKKKKNHLTTEPQVIINVGIMSV